MDIRRRVKGEDRRTAHRDADQNDSDQSKPATSDSPQSNEFPMAAFHWLLVAAFLTAVFVFVQHLDAKLVPALDDSPQNRKSGKFLEARARGCLKTLTGFGPRPVGTPALEENAIPWLLKEIENLQESAKNHDKYTLDMDVQRPSGCFNLDIFGTSTVGCFQNITNVVVRLSQKDKKESERHALLVNCHTDSVPDSPGASDDGASCCIMLEILRLLIARTEPPLDHDVIFLFNSAEETLLKGSHGFIKQHPWRHAVRAFVNLEGAGAGGREVLFQAGPGKPWLVKAYLQHAPHPHANVLAQELFQGGLIPSDTDFRIFRDHGLISGLDIAFVKNGYVYHTEFDSMDMIPPGSIQRAGEHVLAVVEALANSTYLSAPGDYEKGQQRVVFFDLLGLV